MSSPQTAQNDAKAAPPIQMAALLMVKNEAKAIRKTLDSLVDFDSVVVYDTGSTDGTIDAIKDFKMTNPDLRVRLLSGEFVDFATSRNAMIEFAERDPLLEWMTFVDANDEFRGTSLLRRTLERVPPHLIGLFLRQTCQYSDSHTDAFFNIRTVRAGRKWAYKGVVHEYLECSTRTDKELVARLDMADVEVFQDRRTNTESSLARYTRDLELLLEEREADPTNTRTIFYLAQTYACLNQTDKAREIYKERAVMAGFSEEVFIALLRVGDYTTDEKERVAYWMKALEHSPRVEACTRLANHYIGAEKRHLAYAFTSLAMTLKYPAGALLWVENEPHDYLRYHYHGIVAYYLGDFKGGEAAARKAVEAKGLDVDKTNLEFYTKCEVAEVGKVTV